MDTLDFECSFRAFCRFLAIRLFELLNYDLFVNCEYGEKVVYRKVRKEHRRLQRFLECLSCEVKLLNVKREERGITVSKGSECTKTKGIGRRRGNCDVIRGNVIFEICELEVCTVE